jgi:type I site-specific restriction-modification system R (restriction) subunit
MLRQIRDIQHLLCIFADYGVNCNEVFGFALNGEQIINAGGKFQYFAYFNNIESFPNQLDDLKKAFNDIRFYNDTIFADGGRLFEYVQLFVISNGTNTKYFAKYFFAKHSLLNMLTKFMVFDTGERLLAMRPYQIFAAEAIISKVICSHENSLAGSKQACGYIWHATGSGKTLTSFKTAQLIANLDFIDKILFVPQRLSRVFKYFLQF